MKYKNSPVVVLSRLTLACFVIASVSLLLPVASWGQVDDKPPLELPECDIFLFDLDDSATELKISNGRNVTNRPGYDNQPWFTPDSQSFLYSANFAPDRTDVYEYLISEGKSQQVTDSPTQEYSPQISPDNKTLSFVTDGETANQSVWFGERGSQEFQWLLAGQGEREPVGYYSWNHSTDYILFWSRYGFSMRLVHKTKSISHYVTGDAIPTTPYIIPGTDKFSFMHQQGNGEVWIKELDPITLAVRPLTVVIGSNRNYGWTPGGQIIMCDGTKLHRWSPKNPKSWVLVADLGESGLESITRVAVSPNGKHLAVVGVPSDP